jgi:hypothetical protein
MTTRILRPDEYGRLTGTELEPAIATMDPSRASIVVVEDESGQIIGCWGLFKVTHAEGIWIREDHRRKGSVARRLLGKVRSLLVEWNERAFITGSREDGIANMLMALGGLEIHERQFAVPSVKE